MNWIKVTDQLPPLYPIDKTLVLFVSGKKELLIGYCIDHDWANKDKTAVYFNDMFYGGSWEIGYYWMHLPELPEVKS